MDPWLVQNKVGDTMEPLHLEGFDDEAKFLEEMLEDTLVAQTTQELRVRKPDITVLLLHKPRGGKGVWKQIQAEEQIRVTKGVGKKMKVTVESTKQFSIQDVELHLIDEAAPHSREESGRFKIENNHLKPNGDGGSTAELELKLFHLSKVLYYQVKVKTALGLLTGVSCIFGAHNSGKQRARKKADSDSGRKRKRFMFEHVVPGSLNVQGTLHAQNIVQYSDLRLKTNIKELTDALETVKKLQGKNFTWKHNQVFDKDEPQKRVIGLIAQEVQRVLPDAVYTDEQGFLSVSYVDMIPMVLEALKQHLRNYDSDKRSLKSDMAEISKQVDQLQQYKGEKAAQVRAELEDLQRQLDSIKKKHNTGFPLNGGSVSAQREYLQRIAQRMKEFGRRRILPEAQRQNAKLSICAIQRNPNGDLDDFYLVCYKHDGLLPDVATTIGKGPHMGRCISIGGSGSDYTGIYTAIVGIDKAKHPNFCSHGGIVALFDWRKYGMLEEMKLIPCTPVKIATTATEGNLWLVGRFVVTNFDSFWVSTGPPPSQQQPNQEAANTTYQQQGRNADIRGPPLHSSIQGYGPPGAQAQPNGVSYAYQPPPPVHGRGYGGQPNYAGQVQYAHARGGQQAYVSFFE